MMHLSTQAVHVGQRPDPHNGAVSIPIFTTVNYAFEGIGRTVGEFEYSRSANPNRYALETVLATLEGGQHGICFASGQAATTAVLSILRSGDEIVTLPGIYGGTHRIFSKILPNLGISVKEVKEFTPQSVAEQITEKTAMVWLESPTNPLLSIIDIAGTVGAVKQKSRAYAKRPVVVVDNTFPSPALQQPLKLGADIVTHSCTKYIGGHSDTIGGAVIVNDDRLWTDFTFYQNAAGAVPGPFDCYLQLRGIRTLPLRMKKHGENAAAVADFLRGHKNVDKVYFPGFEDFLNHDIAVKQMSGMTGIVSFEVKVRGKSPITETDVFYRKLQLFIRAESLGGVESLANHAATMTHAGLTPEERRAAGIKDNLIRLSLGIEDADDLIADLKQALE